MSFFTKQRFDQVKMLKCIQNNYTYKNALVFISNQIIYYIIIRGNHFTIERLTFSTIIPF